MLRRRNAILAGGAAGLLGAAKAGPAAAMPGRLMGPDAALGHRLRTGDLPEPTSTQRARVVVVGGGIAGLSAAWRLQMQGVEDVLLIEMEAEVGGNARGGRNAVSAYPWGAHYVPLLTAEAVHAQALFEELGIITGRDTAGQPIYDEYALCADPRERLFRDGIWQEDLLPEGVTERDRAQYRAFFTAMDGYRATVGADGHRAFCIPMELSSADASYRALDGLSMATFMRQRGWDSPPLLWYVEYACRDDFGTNPDQVSAWAGIHYFAARGTGRSEEAGGTVLAWPEGNAYLVNRMKALIAPAQCAALAWRVTPGPNGVAIDVYEPGTDRTRRIEAEAAILAVPHFVADRLLGRPGDAAHSYAPWMVANVTLDALPRGRGAQLAWDNVVYNSRSLGYVVATHQSLQRVRQQTVVTAYWPLTDAAPDEARRAAMRLSLPEWQKLVLDELLQVHPELEGNVSAVDVWLWAHGMIRPTPGYLWGSARAASCVQRPPVFFAHSDMSGISLFEEANYRGVVAADAVQAFLA